MPDPESVAVVVLAGGTSRRFGSDKLAVRLGAGTLLDAALEALPADADITAVGPARPTVRPVRWVREDPPGGGPAAGLVAGVRHALRGGATLIAVLPADAPGAGRAATQLLALLRAEPGLDALVGTDADGREQPLQLALRPGAAEQLASTAGGGQGASARALVAALVPGARPARLGAEVSFDIDTPAQLAVWAARHSAAVDAVLDLAARRRPPVVVALDGPSGSGKSTLAGALGLRTAAVVVPGDDFLSHEWAAAGPAAHRHRPDAEVVAQVFDWARLRTEALLPLAAGRAARYRPFDWTTLATGPRLGAQRTLEPAPLVVVDGVYAARPELADLLDVTVLVTAPEPVRTARLVARGDDPRWSELWRRAEAHYFSRMRTADDVDLVVSLEIEHDNGT